MSLTVGNLPAGTTIPELVALFRPFGWVSWADLGAGAGGPAATGRVDLAAGGAAAVAALNGAVYRGRALAVAEARTPAGPAPAPA